MPRHVQHPKSIQDFGGLKPYLNSTADRHNGLKYRDFKSRIDPKRKHPPSKASIAEDFGVNSRTIYSWIAIEEKSTLASLPER